MARGGSSPKRTTPVVRHAAEDLADYFAKAMDVEAHVSGGTASVPSATQRMRVDADATERVPPEISIGLSNETEKLQSRITVTADRIRIAGGKPREAARRLVNVGDFFRRSVMTLRNAYRFFSGAKEDDPAALRRIVADERANVLATMPLVEFDSSLGWEPTMGYVCDRKVLEWKLSELDELLKRL